MCRWAGLSGCSSRWWWRCSGSSPPSSAWSGSSSPPWVEISEYFSCWSRNQKIFFMWAEENLETYVCLWLIRKLVFSSFCPSFYFLVLISNNNKNLKENLFLHCHGHGSFEWLFVIKHVQICLPVIIHLRIRIDQDAHDTSLLSIVSYLCPPVGREERAGAPVRQEPGQEEAEGHLVAPHPPGLPPGEERDFLIIRICQDQCSGSI